MTRTIPERDWRYLQSIKQELLDLLCQQINEKAVAMVTGPGNSSHEKYLRLYKHLQKSDRIVADCFNDWRRSTAWTTLHLLRRHELLSDGQFEHLSEETQELIGALEALANG